MTNIDHNPAHEADKDRGPIKEMQKLLSENVDHDEMRRSLSIPKWEYCTEVVDTQGKYLASVHYIDLTRIQEEYDSGRRETWKSINELGAEGWELISVVYEEDGEAFTGFFKRQINV